MFQIHCRFWCYCKRENSMKCCNGSPSFPWRIVFLTIVVLQFYYNFSLFFLNAFVTESFIEKNSEKIIDPQLAKELYNRSKIVSYDAFVENKNRPKINLGAAEMPKYKRNTPVCKLNTSTLAHAFQINNYQRVDLPRDVPHYRPVPVNKTKVPLAWVEHLYPEVKSGGFYAPHDCRSRHRVAILITFQNRETNLAIFLRHIHPFLMKQLLEYRIFVIEQYATLNFNKGALYNVGFLESQRFGDWRCLVFHDLDLLPMHARNLYSCPRAPTHMSPSVESQGFIIPYDKLFGGVTVMTPAQYSAVNGYSNLYWGWGAEDDDMFVRLQASRYPVLRYNKSFGRYATLPHKPGAVNEKRHYYLSLAKRRFRHEGLNTLKYRRISVTKRKLFTHILVEAPISSYIDS